jgi:hypothetical protein
MDTKYLGDKEVIKDMIDLWKNIKEMTPFLLELKG